MLDAYISAMREELSEIDEELQELTRIALNRELNKFEHRAAERLLQLYIEACIGISKHSVKKAKKNVPNDAFGAMEKLSDLKLFDIGDLDSWHKIIGLRNVLVHDYLIIDRRIVKSVLVNQYYRQLREFSKKGLEYLGLGK